MTVNKSQDQSLWYVGLNLQSPTFSHGQLYVGTYGQKIKVLFKPGSTDRKTQNIVYQEVFGGLQL